MNNARLAGSNSSLVVESDAREVTLNGQPITLTRVEFDLLQAMWSAPNRVLTHAHLLSVISGSSWFGDSHSLEVHICRLRRKLGESGSSQGLIRTVRGVGYKFVPAASAQSLTTQDSSIGVTDPVTFEREWHTARMRADAYFMHRDSELVVRELSSNCDTFLGWRPEDLLGRFASLNPQPILYENQSVAILVSKAFAELGLTHTIESNLVRTPHTLLWTRNLRRVWLSPEGELGGVENIYIPLAPPPRTPDLS